MSRNRNESDASVDSTSEQNLLRSRRGFLQKVGATVLISGLGSTIATGTASAESDWPVFRQGHNDEELGRREVHAIQYFLQAHGYSLGVDGVFGPNTKKQVSNFQRANGLSVDGIVGSGTWSNLIITTSRGSQGIPVKAVQDQLRYDYGYDTAVDGIYGPNTEAGVERYQRGQGLSADGIAGPNTWFSLAWTV